MLLLIVSPDSPPLGMVATELARDALDVEVIERAALVRRPPQDCPCAVEWLPSPVGGETLANAVSWRGNDATMLLGCAPTGDTQDSERALAAGFDDFMAGRTSARELAARVRALSRRAADVLAQRTRRTRSGRIGLDAANHEVIVDGRRVPVTVRELALVSALVRGGGRTLTRAQLLDESWGDDLDVGPRAVDNLILRLRRKLGDPALIVTVRGVGFRL